jgi:hypothetical protein
VSWAREKDDHQPQAAAVAPDQASVEPQQQQPRELSERERWEQRRTQIRVALAARVGDEDQQATVEVDGDRVELDAEALEQMRRETVARARAGFKELRRACQEDLGSDATGSITISAVVIGDPQIGTIFDSVQIVTETVGDPELLACVREAMYAYVGEPPPVLVKSSFVNTMPVGRPDDEEHREQVMFDTIVGAHHGEIAACQRDEAFEGVGTALVEFTINADYYAKTRVARTNLPDSLAECIAEAGQGWLFPKTIVDKTLVYEFELPVKGLDPILEK